MFRATMLAAATLLVATAHADAHALLRKAVPAVGGTVRTPPVEVLLTFSEAVEPRFSSIAVLDAAGRHVEDGAPMAHGDDLMEKLKPLAPGVYRVEWHATSVDTHKTQGNFSFTVAP